MTSIPVHAPRDDPTSRFVTVCGPFSLGKTAAPVAWGKGRWPSVHWERDCLFWVGEDEGHVVWRTVSQPSPDVLLVTGSAAPSRDRDWLARVLGLDAPRPTFDDPVLAVLAGAHQDQRPFSYGSLWEGLVSSIVGQGVSVASGATMLSRLAALHHPGVEPGSRRLWPIPAAADLVRAPVSSLRNLGLTGQRAETIVRVANAWLAPDADWSPKADARAQDVRLLALKGVGPWTVASARLWGLADPDAHPSGDVALLRAARLVFGQPDLTMRGLDQISERWRPQRAEAARLLWLSLLGSAPTDRRVG